MIHFYILKDGEPVPTTDHENWIEWFENHASECVVDRTKIGDCTVSTVFLGLDTHMGNVEVPAPVLWETLILGGPHHGEGIRYTSLADAKQGHMDWCAYISLVHQSLDAGG
jgi:hypothetical protein